MTMSLPVCCFSFETSAAISPLSTCELFHSSFLRVLVATCLGMLLNRSANPSGSLRLGHEAAKPSYVTRPKRRASEEKVSSCLNLAISSFQYGNDHFSGDSTTPSNDTNKVAASRRVGVDIGSSRSVHAFLDRQSQVLALAMLTARRRRFYSLISHCGFHTISHRCPSGSWK